MSFWRVPGVEAPVKIFYGKKAALLFSVSALALIIDQRSAWADCTPDPVADNGTVTCSGTAPNGFQTSSANVHIIVDADANVTPGAASQAAIQLNNDYNMATIDVAGTINGQTVYGLLAQGSGSLNITVSSTGAIQGAEAIFTSLTGGGTIPSLNIDNSGQIIGATDWAVDLGLGSIGIMTNHAGATISGGITTYSLGQASNDGVIDGGSHPALYVGSYRSTITNTGTLKSSANGPGLFTDIISTLYVQQGNVTNSGTIEALGNGPAISANTGITVTNQKGGLISAAQGAAIQGGYAFNNVINAGLITGNVVLQGSHYGDSFIQQGGNVQGNVTFGGADDHYIIDLAYGSDVGVTGTIDGGGGINSFGVTTAADASFMPLAMPNFQQFYAAVTSADATLTLTPTASPLTQMLDFIGDGTIVNNADVSTTDVSAAAAIGFDGQGLIVQNNATITTARQNSLSTSLTAVQMGGNTSLTNAGTIHGEGSGVSAITTLNNDKIINSGQIIADQAPAITTNNYYSRILTINNQADGLISGGSGTAIQGMANIDNTGTITGSVNLIYGLSSYIAEVGGILQGNLNFSGSGNVFKVDYSLLNSGRGVTGTINAGTDYGIGNLFAVLTSGAQSLSLPDFSGFDRFGIETRDGATTTTFGTPSDTITQEIEIAGPGTVVNQAHLVISQAAGHFDMVAVSVTNDNTSQGSTFINQGPIDVSFGTGIRSLGSVTIENTAAISVSNGAIGIYSNGGVNNWGASIINSGAITSTDANSTGVRLVRLSTLHNQGIVQTEGNAVALYYGGIVQNSGSITSGTTAIMGAYSNPTVIRNESGGTITGTDYAIQCPGCSSLIYNAGTINGAVNLRWGTNIYIDAGGSLNGATDFEYANNIFLIQQNTGASLSDLSNFDTANSQNTIGWAIDGAGVVILAPVAGYTGHAVGTMTSDSTATIAPGTQVLSAPVLLLGTGTVINQANLSNANGFALQSYSYAAGIVNQGAITGNNGIILHSGAKNLQNDESITTAGTAIQLNLNYAVTPNDETPWSTINNNGIIAVDSGQLQPAILVASNFYSAGPSIDLSAGVSTVPMTSQTASPPADYTLVQINNSGTITTNGNVSAGIEANGGAHLRVDNSGTISTIGIEAAGIWLTSDGGSISNSGRIETQGVNAPAVWESYDSEPESLSALSLVNSGTITASGGGMQYTYTDQEYQYINGNWVFVTLPTVTNTISAPTIHFNHGTILNTATGTISASGFASIALHLTDYSAETVTMTNVGVITGSGGGTYPVATNQPGVQDQVVLPGAILGGAGVEIINNAGLIAGGVDLGAGNDIVVWRQGGRFQGSVDGGAGANSLTVEANNARIDASAPFVNFQTVEITSSAALDVVAGSTLTTGSIQIDAGGTLGGAGTIIGNINNFGTISPGDSTGATAAIGIHTAAVTPPTLTINGDVTFEAGATLSLQVQGGQTSLLAINGNAVINGGTLNFVVDNASPRSFNLPVLTTTGTLTGAFSQILANGFMTATPVATANGFSFNFLRQIGTGLTFAPQSQRVVTYFNDLFLAGAQGGAVDTVISFSSLPSDQLDGIFAQLHPEAYGSALQLGLRQSIAVSDAFEAGLNATARISGQDWGLWAQGLGAFATQNADATLGTEKFSVDNYGMLAGLDYAWSKGLRAGVMAGYSDGRQNFTGLAANTKTHGYVIGGYGAYQHDSWAVSALIAYNGSTAKTYRQLAITSALAIGGYDLNSLIAGGKASYTFDLHDTLQLVPSAGLTFVRVKRNTTIEQGAGSLDLVVDGDRYNTLMSDFGFKLTSRTEMSGGKSLIPEMSIGWRHDLINDGVNVTARFAGLEGQSALVMRAPGASRDQAIMSAGAILLMTERVSLSAHYQRESGGGLTSNSVNLGMRAYF